MDAVKTSIENGQIAINVLLNAQRSLAQAESDYFRSVTNYAKSISQVHFRKGSLLEYNGVYLTEGPWPAKAYFDARRRARSRSAALYLDYGFTCPKVFSQGPIQQSSGKVMGAEETPANAPAANPDTPASRPSGDRPEVLPAPQSQPPDSNPLPRPATPREPVRPDATAAETCLGRRTHDIGSLDLSSLARKADGTGAVSDRNSAVQPAGYQGQ